MLVLAIGIYNSSIAQYRTLAASPQSVEVDFGSLTIMAQNAAATDLEYTVLKFNRVSGDYSLPAARLSEINNLYPDNLKAQRHFENEWKKEIWRLKNNKRLELERSSLQQSSQRLIWYGIGVVCVILILESDILMYLAWF
jgi:hypothetical protein